MHTRRAVVVSSALAALVLAIGSARAQQESGQSKPKSCIPLMKNPERHTQFMKDKAALEKKGPIELVFEGDSITDFWRGRGRFVFNEEYTRFNCFNTAVSGDRTEHLLWRIDHGELDGLNPKAVVLMIGTNNLGNKQSVADTIAGIKCVVASIHQKLPESNILLLGVFPRGHKANDPFRAQIKQVNDAISQLNGTENVTYLDIGPYFLDRDGTLAKNIMPDYLHPDLKGYMIWAEAMKPTLRKLMK